MRNTLVMLCLLAVVLSSCVRQPPEYASQYTPPTSPAEVVPPMDVAIIGDSYTSGSVMGEYRAQRWPDVSAERLSQQGIAITPMVGAQDGSGYVAIGHTHDRVFADRITEVVGPNTRLVVLFGSPNDMETPPDVLAPAIQQTLAAAKSSAPKARLLVIGPAWATTEPPLELLAVRDVLKTSVETLGTTFVDPIAEGWFTDQLDLLGADGTSPTDTGHRYLADKITPLIAQELRRPPIDPVEWPR